MPDPLEVLLLDSQEVDRERVATALRDLVGIDAKSGKIVLRPGFNDVDTARRVVAYLLGAFAARLLGKRESEIVPPSEIQAETGMPKGTVNPKLSQLHRDRRIAKTRQGAYFIAGHQVGPAVALLARSSRKE